MWKSFLLGAAKSKTINVNVLATLALMTILSKYQITLTPDEAMAYTALAYAIVNLILRMVTGKSLPEKGLEIKLPKYTDTIVEKVSAIVESKQPTVEAITDEVIKTIIERQRTQRQIVDSK